jgi:sugar O-acyltransferase (sialic acid O-acetyltransferase NeuD family)
MKKLLIYGNGAMARLLYSYVRHSREVCGFTVDDQCMFQQDSFCNLALVPFTQVETVFDPTECEMIIAIGFIDMNDLRARKYEEAKAKGYSFGSYVHASMLRHEGVSIEENCIILDHVSIHPGCTIRRGVFITSNVNLGHDCVIGANTWINAGVAMGGGCTVGERCFMGVNSSLGHGVKLGAQTFIAANTFVGHDTQDNEVYVSEAGQLFRLNSKAFLKFSRIFD